MEPNAQKQKQLEAGEIMQDRDKIEEEKETTKIDKKYKQEIQDDKEGENNKGSRNNRARSK